MPLLSQESRREEKRAFRLFDRNNDGVINTVELGVALRQLGQNPTEEELKDMISEIDKENKGVIDLNDFLNLISLKTHTTSQQTQSPAPGPGLSLTETLHNASEDEMREAFRVFDRDGDGLINETEMLLTLLGLGETGITEEKVREIIAEADDDKDGKLSYQEFIKYLGVIPKASEL